MSDFDPRAVGPVPTARGSFRAIAALVGFLIALTAPAYPHAGEFILAKFIQGKGSIRVELTIDCTGHPLIRSEAEAHQALSKSLILHAGGRVRPLGEIAPFRYERRTAIDPETPIPKDTHDTDRPHQIVTAHWQTELPAGTITLQNAADSGQSMILWNPPDTPGEQPRWIMLVPGDTSPPITIQPAPPSRVLHYTIAGIAACAAALAMILRTRRLRARAQSVSPQPFTTIDTP
jgi:hypothetical protein